MATPGQTIAVGKLMTPGGKQGPKGDVGAPLPVGAVILWVAGGTPPAGWLEADGSAISRTIYAELFALIGTTYGTGDGSTTFNLPDPRGRFILAAWAGHYSLGAVGGEDVHILSVAEMPSHQHNLTFGPGFDFTPTGSPTGWKTIVTTSLGTSATGGGGPHNNMPPYCVFRYIIKVLSSTGAVAPLADATQDGLLRKVSGLTTDFVDGTNHCQDLGSGIKLVMPRLFNAAGNPTFEINQRQIPGASLPNVYVDRWNTWWTGGNITGAVAQGAAIVNVPGTNFAISQNFLRFQSTKQITTLAAADAGLLMYGAVEGINLRELISDVTSLQILVRSSVAPLTLTCILRSSVGTLKSICKLFPPITVANTWQLLKCPNIAKWASDVAWATTSGTYGYEILIGIGSGSTPTTPANDVWNNGSSYYHAIGASNFFANPVNSTIDIAFIQHEPGPVCSQPMDLDWHTNLIRCQRHYCKNAPYASLPCQGNWMMIGTIVPGSTLSQVLYPVSGRNGESAHDKNGRERPDIEHCLFGKRRSSGDKWCLYFVQQWTK